MVTLWYQVVDNIVSQLYPIYCLSTLTRIQLKTLWLTCFCLSLALFMNLFLLFLPEPSLEKPAAPIDFRRCDCRLLSLFSPIMLRSPACMDVTRLRMASLLSITDFIRLGGAIDVCDGFFLRVIESVKQQHNNISTIGLESIWNY